MTTPCLHTAFAECAARVPHRAAVTFGAEHITYRELDRRAEELAERLRRCGVRPGVRVGVCVERSIELVVSLLAVLKAGGAYVPADSDHPASRVSFVLADSEVAVTVALTRTADALAQWSGPVLWSDAPAEDDPVTGAAVGADAGPDDAAYVIYTSGSTGTPKGVEVAHRSVVALLARTAELFEYDDLDSWTMCHSIGFDFSVWELWGPLLTGGRVVIVPTPVTRNPALLLDVVRREHITVLSQTPSAFRRLVAADRAAGGPDRLDLRLVVFGGERLDVAALAPWIERHGDTHPELINMYGITEVTVHATYRRITAADLDRPGSSPIGRALPGMRVEPRDDAGRAVPDGVPGELYVAGTGLALGYLNRPELTAERFVTVDGERWYRSGDRGVRSGDDLVYLSRSDRQLKVRGYRVEPGEVEACLLAAPGVGAAVVSAEDFGDGDVRLVAHVAPPPGTAAGALSEEVLRTAVADLPGYLQPSAFRVVDDIPLTAQGKADTAALHVAAPAPSSLDGLDATTATVKAITDEVMRADVPLDGDLFDRGATSIALARIIAMVNDRLGTTLTGAELDEPTITCLAGVAGATRPDMALQGMGG